MQHVTVSTMLRLIRQVNVCLSHSQCHLPLFSVKHNHIPSLSVAEPGVILSKQISNRYRGVVSSTEECIIREQEAQARFLRSPRR